VMPSGLTSAKRAQFWIPLGLPAEAPDRTLFYSVVGRMKSDARIETVRAEVATVVKRLVAEMSEKHRAQRAYGAAVITLQDRRFGDTKRALLLLFSTVGILLLIACANLANLSLARAARREREFALRATLGASRSRIVRYVLCECLVLSGAGALLGALLATMTVGYFVRISPGALATAEGIRVDASALVFTLVIAVATAVLFGLIPALRAARGGVTLIGTPRAAGSRRERVVRHGLIVVQLATALVMVTGAALVTKTLARVASIDTGINTENLLVVEPTLGRERYTPAAAEAFYQELTSRLRRDADVAGITIVDAVPIGGRVATFDQTDAAGKRIMVDVVSADQA